MSISMARAVHVPAEEREVCHEYGHENARQAIYQHARNLSRSGCPRAVTVQWIAAVECAEKRDDRAALVNGQMQ